MTRVIQTGDGRYQGRYTSEMTGLERVRTFDVKEDATRWLTRISLVDQLEALTNRIEAADNDDQVRPRQVEQQNKVIERRQVIVRALEHGKVPLALVEHATGLTQQALLDIWHEERTIRRRENTKGYLTDKVMQYQFSSTSEDAFSARAGSDSPVLRELGERLKAAARKLRELGREIQAAMTLEAEDWMNRVEGREPTGGIQPVRWVGNLLTHRGRTVGSVKPATKASNAPSGSWLAEIEFDGRSLRDRAYLSFKEDNEAAAREWVETAYFDRLGEYREKAARTGEEYTWYGKFLYDRGVPVGEVGKKDVGWQAIVYSDSDTGHRISQVVGSQEEAETWAHKTAETI